MGDETVVLDLTAAHLALLRAALVSWDITEGGAPTFDPERPYGSARPWDDVARLTGERRALNTRRLKTLHAEMKAVLEIALAFGRLEPGEYSYPNRLAGRASIVSADILAEDGTPPPETIAVRVTPEHLQLLTRASIRWNDWPDELGEDGLVAVPGFDPKRPYGNFTAFEVEMAQHLGIPLEKDPDGVAILPPALGERLRRMHREMQPVLQVFVQRARLDAGRYEGDEYGNWERR